MTINQHSIQQNHSHDFHEGNPIGERNTKRVVILTFLMMILEILGGWWFNSMALLADGWHMSSHTLALGLSVAAYVAARRLAGDSKFSFGTWKIEVLGGYTSAILLLGVAAAMIFQSVERLLAPAAIHYNEAIVIAILGLITNVFSAFLLSHEHHHHDHEHHHHHDLNLRSAYLHVLADAATSVLAILALVAGKLWGWAWMDPAMGIVGAILVAIWALGLIRDTGTVLLDAEMDSPVVGEIKDVIDSLKLKPALQDLHVWRVGKGKYACIISITVAEMVQADAIKKALRVHEELVHITVEVNLISSP